MRALPPSIQRKAGIVLSYADMALQIVISLVYTPVMLSLLGQSEYGLYSLASSIVSYLSLITLGMGGAYIRFYMRYKVKDDDKGIRQLNGMYLIFYMIAGVAALLAGSVVVANTGNIFTALTPYEIGITKILLALLMLNLAISFPASLFNSYITANECFITQRVLTLARHVSSPLLVLPILLMGYGSVGYVLVTVGVNIAFEIFNICYAVGKLRMCFSIGGFKWSLFKEVAIFSFFLLLNQIIDQVNGNVGNLLLGIYQGSAAVAVYGVARQITQYFFSFSTAVSSVYEPRVNRLVANGAGMDEITRLMTRVGRVQFIIMALILSGLIFFGTPFVYLWAGPDYLDAYYIILLLCCPVVIPLIQNTGIAIQQAMNKHQVRSIAYSIMAVFNVMISIPMIQRYSSIGAAIGTCISYILCNIIFMNIYYHKGLKLDMVYFWKEIAKFIPSLIFPVAFGIGLSISSINLYSWKSLILWIVAYTAVYCLSMWLLGMNKDEKSLVHRITDRLIGKRKSMENKTPYVLSDNADDESKALSFRLKESGWKDYQIRYENGHRSITVSHSSDPFMKAFLSNHILRPSCYACEFKADGYHSDITLGDFWNIDNALPGYSDDKGVSEVIVRSQKGLACFMALDGLDKVEVTESGAYQDSLYNSVKVPAGRDEWFMYSHDHSIVETNNAVMGEQSQKSQSKFNPIRIAKGVKCRIARRICSKTNIVRPTFEKFLVDERHSAGSPAFDLKQTCVGCGACATACQKNAIAMRADAEGFLYPVFDNDKCVDCSLCQKVCPVKNQVRAVSLEPQYWAAKCDDDEVRMRSSSGGVFSLLAREVLSSGGVVFGAAFDDKLHVKHISAENEPSLIKLCGSKYVQSEMGTCYKDVKDELKKGRQVLFSGTPCQVAGLKSYLGGDNENLLSVDLICHGAPSPLVFSKYVQELEILIGGGDCPKNP